MKNIERRLETLARMYGCPEHGEMLVCSGCDPSEAMPAWLQVGVDTLVDGIIARVPKHDLRIAFTHVVPPTAERCPRCEGQRGCARCTERYAKGLFQAIGLTPQEDAALKALMAKVRAVDAGG